MIERHIKTQLVDRLAHSPAVALLGPRQVGKTTLAQEVGEARSSLYLDLESEADRAKLTEPELYLSAHEDKLVILDEVHRVPELFGLLRGLIDRGRRKGFRAGRFLLLGSASMDLLAQSSESLAGRISYLEMGPLDALEIAGSDVERLWIRGGFPDSYLAGSDRSSQRWRQDFIRTYLERDIPAIGPRIPAETLRRFWTMLAHHQSGLLNASEFARSLGVTSQTVANYLDLLVDLLLVRRLAPWYSNGAKRLVKSPRVYVRDSGLVHTLLGLTDREAVLGHPVAGASWEGFVIESLVAAAPEGTEAYFYRTSAGAEIDLLLRHPDGRLWVFEVKRSLSPKVERGFHSAGEDLSPDRRILIYPGSETFPLGNGIEVMSLSTAAHALGHDQ
ncbi:ATPase (plasmid) [Sphingobium sp. LB126]|uniref:ATP-binding protein n=1 Tax=Sphingobium sp. LB126 TaxID=1983755 RepID=UPI000C20B868|nr:ATP-binding protein [Sphingobium sp. LB126]PJG45137.1 ATPase [Sphingobium sp. LB126]